MKPTRASCTACARKWGGQVSVFYESGVQWKGWGSAPDVMMGRGINRQIRRAYGYLASRYRPGDRIYLFGYSRGAYAVRSLAGVIDRIGLLRPEHATVRHIRTAYRHYRLNGAPIPALPLPLPIATTRSRSRWSASGIPSKRWACGCRCFGAGPNGSIISTTTPWGRISKAAITRWRWTRRVTCSSRCCGTAPRAGAAMLNKCGSAGAHGDVGGQLGGFEDARPLANVSLIWMLEKAEERGLPLPLDWRMRFRWTPRRPQWAPGRAGPKSFCCAAAAGLVWTPASGCTAASIRGPERELRRQAAGWRGSPRPDSQHGEMRQLLQAGTRLVNLACESCTQPVRRAGVTCGFLQIRLQAFQRLAIRLVYELAARAAYRYGRTGYGSSPTT